MAKYFIQLYLAILGEYERLAEYGLKPHRDLFGSTQIYHGPHITGICMSNRGVRFHQIRDFKPNNTVSIHIHIYIYIYIYTQIYTHYMIIVYTIR